MFSIVEGPAQSSAVVTIHFPVGAHVGTNTFTIATQSSAPIQTLQPLSLSSTIVCNSTLGVTQLTSSVAPSLKCTLLDFDCQRSRESDQENCCQFRHASVLPHFPVECTWSQEKGPRMIPRDPEGSASLPSTQQSTNHANRFHPLLSLSALGLPMLSAILISILPMRWPKFPNLLTPSVSPCGCDIDE